MATCNCMGPLGACMCMMKNNWQYNKPFYNDKTPWVEQFKPCNDPSHDIPSMMVFPQGQNSHTCPSCKRTVTFYVSGPTL